MIAVALLGFAATVYLFVKDNQGPTEETYVSCGCGGCEGSETTIKYLYATEGGEEKLAEIKQKDKELLAGNACATMGCSICTEYRLVELT